MKFVHARATHAGGARILRMHSAIVCASLILFTGAVHGQSQWLPEKPVEIIVPTGAGGINDRISRLMQRVLQDGKLVPTPMVVMNKAGGNQSLSVVYLTQKAPDPHHLLYATATLFTNQLAGLTPLGYKDLSPLACLVVDHTVITVAADSPIRSLRDFMDQLKGDPGAVSFGMVSRGGPNHLALSQAVRSAGIDPRKLRTVVFKTNAESNMAVIGGHIQAVVSSASAALPQAQAGQTRMLAIVAAERAAGPLAQVPTVREQGVSATGIANWRAIFGPKGMSAAQVAFWDSALARMASAEEWNRELDGTNMSRQFLRSGDFSRYLDEEFAATRAVMADLGLVK